MKLVTLLPLVLIVAGCATEPLTKTASPISERNEETQTGSERFTASVGSVFRCYSPVYTDRQATIIIAGTVIEDQKIFQLEMKDDVIGLDFHVKSVKAVEIAKNRPGYARYHVGENPLGRDFQPISIMLPEKMATVSGRFEAYVSDANSAHDRAPEFFKVICRK